MPAKAAKLFRLLALNKLCTRCGHEHHSCESLTDEMHICIQALKTDIASIRAEAVEAVEFWGEFASNYSKAHHDLEGDIKRLRGEK